MSTRLKRWQSIGLQVLGLAILYVAITHWQTRHALATGKPVPELALRSLDGRAFSLRQMRGQAVLLHFWATWCGVCRLELPALNALEARLPKGAALVSVVADGDDPEHVQRFVREHGLSYPVLLADQATVQRFAVSAFPTNYYIDANGVVREVTVGMSTRLSMWLRLWFLT